ncbi:MAG: DNA ligase D [Gemmatimonadales bacterium]
MSASDDLLRTYRDKRKLGVTPEPAGAVAPAKGGGGVFIVHQHAASHMHWDLRLEMEGVLRSWAVPKGISKNPADKRLAVHVEDHPMEYGEFEGLIPEGNYGAGAVIVWDRGVWIPVEDPIEGLKTGKLLFDFRGHKLHGRWTLVKIKKGERDWLLIKERDNLVEEDGDVFPPGSVLSGLTVEELRDGATRGATLQKALEEAGAPRKAVTPARVELKLCEPEETPFSKAGWIFELKYDGFRFLAARHDGAPLLLTRSGRDVTAAFPEIVRSLARLPYDDLILDGEVVVHDERGYPSFQRLQRRAQLSRTPDIGRAALERPASFYAFDLLAAEGFDLRPLPLTTRKALLKTVLPAAGPFRYADHIDQQGKPFYDGVVQMGLEGMVAKKADAPYKGGRRPDWKKIRADRTGDFVVIGWSAGKGARAALGSLQLGVYDGDTLRYAGSVGSGLSDDQLGDVRATLEQLQVTEPPVANAPSGVTWVTPELVVEVRYKEWTEEGNLRQPVLLRFRDDKPPTECYRETGDGRGETEEPDIRLPSPVSRHEDLRFTNRDKIFWPELGLTKGDLIDYYRAIGPWLLPYLVDRPLVMTRFPDGIHGKSFFQKDAPTFAPDWLRQERVYSGDNERELNYFVADSVDALLYVINLGTIPLHLWSSRIATLEHPDWCSLDLDPGDGGLAHAVPIARYIKGLCDELGLPAFVKTTGSRGLHVLIPLGGTCTHEQAKVLGELLARVTVTDLPDVATVARMPEQREGKVYVDFLQNGRGKLLAAPFCARPVPAATVSMPLDWEELTDDLRMDRFTMKSAPARMEALGRDPCAGVLSTTPDLTGALARLAARMTTV